MSSVPHLPKVVVACTSESRPVLDEALSDIALPVMVLSEQEAVSCLDDNVRLLVCTLRFDDSRMLEFVQSIHQRFAQLPFVCCRVSRTRLPAQSLRTALETARNLGAVDVIDFYALEATLGHQTAVGILREHLAARLTQH